MQRFCLKITGESGSGLLSTGEIVIKALHAMGFYIVADREYPSLIKGGHSCFMINAAKNPISALSSRVDVMLSIDRQSLQAYFDDLKKGGTLVYGYERPLGVKAELEKAKKRKVKVVHQMSREIAEDQGGNVLMVNVVLVGMLWKTLGLPYKFIENQVKEKFASKPRLLEIDLKCLKAGYESVEEDLELKEFLENLDQAGHQSKNKTTLKEGNETIALGAIEARCRAYFAYPMSPSSSILTHMANLAHESKMVVKQVEDEISVANMTVGAMHMGTRAMCATSGGGFDLMTETVSLTGIIECPFVCVIAQRPGPGTGLPTWTQQGDLNLAIHSSHGEFPRIVMAVSDPEDAYYLTQHAFNFAEKYQSPVILLTEKFIAESLVTIPEFKKGKIKIVRGLVTDPQELKKLENSDRYKITKSGISKRWIPGSSEAYYFANGDEHWENGELTEDENAGEMYAKRLRKLETIRKSLPEPEVHGPKKADISFVGWGSSLRVMRDFIAANNEKTQKNSTKKNSTSKISENSKINYLHFSYLWPLKTEKLEKFLAENPNVYLVENNHNGQFGNLVEAEVNRLRGEKSKPAFQFKDRLLKWNGRPFFLEDLEQFIEKNAKKH